jgi:hypothetical protein
MKMSDMYGNVMMVITAVERREDGLVMKGNMMGTMPATIYLKPEDIWESKSLLSWSVVLYFPIMIFKGWWRTRKLKQQ